MITADVQTIDNFRIDEVNSALEKMLALGDVSMLLSMIERAPRYTDGSRETDVEHSFHLALSATELAATYYPELDIGLVSQFSLVHDLPEIHTGDVWTFDISNEDLAKKKELENEAVKRLVGELPPHTASLLVRYEDQIEIEARFVRLVDKLLPSIINIVASEANTFQDDYDIQTLDELDQKMSKRTKRVKQMFPEFTFIHLVHELLNQTSRDYIFNVKDIGKASATISNEP